MENNFYNLQLLAKIYNHKSYNLKFAFLKYYNKNIKNDLVPIIKEYVEKKNINIENKADLINYLYEITAKTNKDQSKLPLLSEKLYNLVYDESFYYGYDDDYFDFLKRIRIYFNEFCNISDDYFYGEIMENIHKIMALWKLDYNNIKKKICNKYIKRETEKYLSGLGYTKCGIKTIKIFLFGSKKFPLYIVWTKNKDMFQCSNEKIENAAKYLDLIFDHSKKMLYIKIKEEYENNNIVLIWNWKLNGKKDLLITSGYKKKIYLNGVHFLE